MSNRPAHDASARYQVTVEGSFVASHQVPQPDGTLEPLHEHDWKVEVTFWGTELDERGMLIDFNEVSGRLSAILESFDGTNLNDRAFAGGAPPTAEVIAAHLFAEMASLQDRRLRLRSVRVQEAPGCAACYFAEEPIDR